MALEAAECSQDPFGYDSKESYKFCGGGGDGNYCYNMDLVGILSNNRDHCHRGINWDSSASSLGQNGMEYLECPNSSPEACAADQLFGEQSPPVPEASSTAAAGPRKRRRTKSSKNREELESQRMTHIAVERNRRKQMNEYLAVIRSLMPDSYVQRGDQASIIGGAINFLKEMEHLLQTLEANKRTTTTTTTQPPRPPNINNGLSPPPFATFFTFPQYSTNSNHSHSSPEMAADPAVSARAFGDIEVTMVESHANLKILSKRRPRQLVNVVAGIQCLRLTILHLNVTTVDPMVLYSLSVKLEDGCLLATVDEIADAVNHLLGRIEEEAAPLS